MKKLRVRTVILSDVHLGTPGSKVREVNHFLRHIRCATLILNGDIIDGWQLRRKGHWTKAHTRFIRIVLKKMEKRGTDVIYLRGNHDDVLSRFLPLEFENLSIVEDYIHIGTARSLSGPAWRRLRLDHQKFPLPLPPRRLGLRPASAHQPRLQPVADVARPRILVPEQGDQGAGQGGRESRLQL